VIFGKKVRSIFGEAQPKLHVRAKDYDVSISLSENSNSMDVVRIGAAVEIKGLKWRSSRWPEQ
jgi:hypothetical protein